MNFNLLIESLQQLAVNHVVLWHIVMFFLMFISNIVPITFFLYPDIILLFWVFLAKKVVVWYWYIPFILLIVSAYLGEIISFHIWRKYWKKLLDYKFFRKDVSKKRIEKFQRNSVKTLIIWKIMPWVVWFVPVFSWITRMDFKKFLIVNLIMVTYSISMTFLIMLFGINLLESHIWKNVWIFVWIFLITYMIAHIIYKMKIKKK